MTDVVIGVDGGGTRTRCMLADALGAQIAMVEGTGSAVRPGQADASAAVIAALVREVLASRDMASVRPKVLSVGVAGVGREPERTALLDALLAEELAEDVIVQTDAQIALEDALGEGSGILIISGTGSVGFGRGPTGQSMRCGGWGPACGDEGSGAWIGRRALSIVTAAKDGREPETALTGAVLTACELNDVDELVAWAAAASPAQLAALAPVVLAVAHAGDLRANSLVALTVEELVLHVRTLARLLFTDERAAVRVALGGGLLAKGSLLRKRLVNRLKSAVPGGTILEDEVVAVRGAVRLAVRSLDHGPIAS